MATVKTERVMRQCESCPGWNIGEPTRRVSMGMRLDGTAAGILDQNGTRKEAACTARSRGSSP